jgi:hypothetical protein
MTDVADVKPTVTGMEIKSISTPARLFPYKMRTWYTRKYSSYNRVNNRNAFKIVLIILFKVAHGHSYMIRALYLARVSGNTVFDSRLTFYYISATDIADY